MNKYSRKILPLLFLILPFASCQNNNNKTSSEESVLSIRKDISVQEAYEKIMNDNENSNLVVIDVRTPRENEQVRLQNAILIDYRDPNFKMEISKLDKNKTYIVHCRSGKRSGKACEIMQEMGFKEVYNVAGGILQWQEADLPVVGLSN